MILAAHPNDKGYPLILGLACSRVGGTLTCERLLVQDSPPAGVLPARLIYDAQTETKVNLTWPSLPEGDHNEPITLEVTSAATH